MEEKVLNERESLQVITSMIERTKMRLREGAGDLMLLWGYLTVGVAALVGALLFLTGNQAWNWLWFLIWIIGGTVTPVMVKKQNVNFGAKTYIDRLCSGIWSLVGWSALGMTAVCLGLFLFDGKDAWSVMLVFALLVVGIIEAVQGMIIKEKSLIFGGAVGMLAGFVTMACIVANIQLYLYWFMPMFIGAWLCMMIIPGHILNHKAKIV